MNEKLICLAKDRLTTKRQADSAAASDALIDAAAGPFDDDDYRG
jgi:hypothetical protein